MPTNYGESVGATREWVGVIHWTSALIMPKHELLFFDRVAVVGLEEAIKNNRRGLYARPDIADQMEWLAEEGLIFDPPGLRYDFFNEQANCGDASLAATFGLLARDLRESAVPFSTTISQSEGEMLTVQSFSRSDGDKLMRAGRLDWARAFLITRLVAAQMRADLGIDAVSSGATPDLVKALRAGIVTPSDDMHGVAHIVLRQLPVPDEDATSMESILEFRKDPDARNQLLALRLWMRAAARAVTSSAELQERITYFLSEYERYLRIHRLKTKPGFLETAITTTAEMIENLAKLKLGESAKLLFRIKHSRLALLEAEAKAPGREVAYVASARTHFAD